MSDTVMTTLGVTLLDEILRPINARLSRLAASHAFVGCAVQAVLTGKCGTAYGTSRPSDGSSGH